MTPLSLNALRRNAGGTSSDLRTIRTVLLLLAILTTVNARAAAVSADSVDHLLDRAFKERHTRPLDALAWARSALGWAEERHDSLRMADALRKIALAQREMEERLDSSFISMERALAISTAIGDRKGEQSAAKSLGMFHQQAGDYARAMAYADRSLGLAEAAGDTKGICSALVTKGLVQKSLGDMEGAAATLYRGLELARTLQDTTRMLDLLNNIGNCYFEIDRYNESITYFREQRDLAAAASRTANLADALRNLGMVAAERGDPGQALLLVDSALAVLDRAEAPMEDRFIAMGNRGNYLLRLGRSDEARAALEQVVEISEDLDRPKDRSFLLADLGDIAIREGRSDDADSLLHAALGDAGRHLRARTIVLRLLSTLRERQERWQEARELLAAYIAARDSFINERATDQLARAEMRQKYKAHEQDLEIDDLETRIAQERELRNLVLGITALTLLLAVLAWRNWRFQRRLRLQAGTLHMQEVSRLLKEQEIRALDAVLKGQEIERGRISKDLHDRVGSLLSAVKMQFGALEGRIGQVQATADAQYRKATDLLDMAVSEVRRISHDMEHGTLATFGLATALEDLCEAVRVPGKLEVELNLFGLEKRLDKRLEVAAYRMVQEAVSNALKHARAANLTIQATRSADTLNLMVEDDGRGFDGKVPGDGMGMANLRERAGEFGGTVRIDSRPGRGTTVVVDLPIARQGA